MKRRQPERDIQVALCRHLQVRGQPGLVWFAVPNGGSRHAIEARNLKRMGVKAGVADLILLHKGRMFSLELKADKNQRMTDAQCDFMSAVKEAGGYARCAIGLDGAIKALERWGVIR